MSTSAPGHTMGTRFICFGHCYKLYTTTHMKCENHRILQCGIVATLHLCWRTVPQIWELQTPVLQLRILAMNPAKACSTVSRTAGQMYLSKFHLNCKCIFFPNCEMYLHWTLQRLVQLFPGQLAIAISQNIYVFVQISKSIWRKCEFVFQIVKYIYTEP